MKIYIIVNNKSGLLESVWKNRALARAALIYYAKESKTLKGDLNIVERELNQLKKSDK